MLESSIKSPDNISRLVQRKGKTGDIIKWIMVADAYSIDYVKNFAPRLAGNDVYETCFNLYNFLHNNIPYFEDPRGKQLIQLPGQFYANRHLDKGGTGKGGDCKSFALFCSAVLRALGNYDFKYRFTSQDKNDDYHHVYLIVKYGDYYITLDCTEKEFNAEVPFEKKYDLAPTKPQKAASVGKTKEQNRFRRSVGTVKISGATSTGIGVTQEEADYETWEAWETDYKTNLPQIEIDVMTRLLTGIGYHWNNPTRRKKSRRVITDNWQHLMLYAYCMIYKFWDNSKAPYPNENLYQYYQGVNLYPKRETGEGLYDMLVSLGCRHADIHDLCRLGTFKTLGITVDYALDRYYNVVIYGQPFKPKPGIPYVDVKNGTFVLNNSPLLLSYMIQVCMPVDGSVGKPWGRPYWCRDGYIISNGGTEEDVQLFAAQNPKPVELIVNNGEGVPQEAWEYHFSVYEAWRKGEIVVPPIPTIEGFQIAQKGSGSQIGYIPIGELAGLIGAIIALVGALVGVIGDIVGWFKKPKGADEIPSPTDFEPVFATVDNCYIGIEMEGVHAGQYAKKCGDVIVEYNPDLSAAENQPAADVKNPSDNKTLLMAGGGLLIGGGLMLNN